jgi:uncharacterized protein YjiS (DUF1127 family)
MDIIDRISGAGANADRTTGHSSPLRTFVVWHAAWREHNALMNLDEKALEDMRITASERDRVTVTQITSRMLG